MSTSMPALYTRENTDDVVIDIEGDSEDVFSQSLRSSTSSYFISNDFSSVLAIRNNETAMVDTPAQYSLDLEKAKKIMLPENALTWGIQTLETQLSTLTQVPKILTSPEFAPQRKAIAGKALLLEKKLSKHMKYRALAAYAIPYPYRLAFESANAVVTATGLDQLMQKGLEKVVEKHIIKDDPYYAKVRQEEKAKRDGEKAEAERQKWIQTPAGIRQMELEFEQKKEQEERDFEERKMSLQLQLEQTRLEQLRMLEERKLDFALEKERIQLERERMQLERLRLESSLTYHTQV